VRIGCLIAIGALAGCAHGGAGPRAAWPFDAGLPEAGPARPANAAGPASTTPAGAGTVTERRSFSTTPAGAGSVTERRSFATALGAARAAGALARAKAGLREDARLEAIARVTAEAASKGYVVSTVALREATVASLGSDVLPYVITARGDVADTEAQLAAALAELREDAALEAIGIAEATGATGRVTALVATPVPTVAVDAARRGDDVTLSLAWPWPATPSAYLSTPGRARKIALTQLADRVEVRVSCRALAGGRFRDAAVEIDAGTRTVASVPAVCGGARAPAAALDVGPPARTAVEIEERLFALVNQARTEAGRAPLAWDADAHRMARDHAADMARGGYVGHVGSGGATLTKRVLGHALRAIETFENVGRAGGPGEAHAAFLASPGHRANLMAVAARRGAIGIAADPHTPGDFYVVEVLFEPSK
jgi:uncharacterized protein YkwD